MEDDWSLKEATLDDLCEQALKHYNKLSKFCSDFNSLIPKAIEYYKKKEILRQKLIEDIEKSIFIDTGHDDIIAIINKRFGVDE